IASHVMNQQIGIEVRLLVLERLCLVVRTGNHYRRVAKKAADAWVGDVSAKQLLPMLCTGREWNRFRWRQPSHEDGERKPVGYLVYWTVKGLVAHVGGVRADNIVRLVDALRTRRCFIPACREQVVGDTHFHVVGFARKDRQ